MLLRDIPHPVVVAGDLNTTGGDASPTSIKKQILVKAYAKDPRGGEEPFRFAPHFARTLDSVNCALPPRLSDHNPISVDLPFEEPGPVTKQPAKASAISVQ